MANGCASITLPGYLPVRVTVMSVLSLLAVNYSNRVAKVNNACVCVEVGQQLLGYVCWLALGSEIVHLIPGVLFSPKHIICLLGLKSWIVAHNRPFMKFSFMDHLKFKVH